MLKAYVDGSCFRNPDGPGGWAVVLVDQSGKTIAEHFGHDGCTTNNRMELTAAIKVFGLAPRAVGCIYSDSQYVVKGATLWLPAWKRRQWLTKEKEPVKNVDLWMELDRLYAPNRTGFQWIKGHAGDRWNERADELATAAAASIATPAERAAYEQFRQSGYRR